MNEMISIVLLLIIVYLAGCLFGFITGVFYQRKKEKKEKRDAYKEVEELMNDYI